MDEKDSIAAKIAAIRKEFGNKRPVGAPEKGRIEFEHETFDDPFVNFANFRTDFYNWDQFSQFDNWSNFRDSSNT